MALHNVLVPIRAGVAGICLVLAAAAGAHAAARSLDAPLVLAQADPDPAADESQGGVDAAALLIRITRLEDRLRSLTGQVEQLQFQNKKLDDQMRKMQQDVDFRFQDLNRAPIGNTRPILKKSDAGDPAGGEVGVAGTASAASDPVVVEAPRSAKRGGDAFDPASNPDAPGAPKPLGTTQPAQPLSAAQASSGSATKPPVGVVATPHAPLDLTPTAQRPVAPVSLPVQEATLAPDAGLRSAPPAGGGSTRADFDGTLALYKGAQYDAAIEGFQSFVQKYPKDRLVPDATYYLGESFARQGRQREAAEQFLKLSTDYTKSSRAPDALLRLGVALNALGAKEQACATYQEVDRKYPAASADVRVGVERELKRAKC